jgi:uncharacterized protein (TIGR00288 family)
MASDVQNTNASNKNIALLIDCDNVSHAYISKIIAELSKYGTANIRRAYGDWSASGTKGWREKLHEFAIRPIQQFSYTSGKNATDMALVIDAMELLYTQKPDAFGIVSSDGDFTPLIMQLRANGHEVFGFGERKTPDPFVNACTSFLYLDGEIPTAANEPAVKPDGEATVSKKLPVSEPKKVAAKSDSRKLSQDTKLVTILRGAIEACAREDGWAAMSAVGSAAKRQAPIDPRNYGEKTFTTLFEAVGLFDVVRTKSGQAYVSDKRNKDRSKEPTA